MSKKNPLDNKRGGITCEKFDFQESKWYIVATIIMFHIVPLIVMFTKDGQSVLSSVFMMLLNPIFLFLTSLFYGVKKGFNVKMPVLMAVLATLSIIMYYEFENLSYIVQTGIVMFVTYLVLDFVGIVIGGFVKSYL